MGRSKSIETMATKQISRLRHAASVKWNDDRPRQAYQLALLGANDQQMADAMGVSISTIQTWKRKSKKFRDSLNDGKLVADAKVAAAFYQRATGFTRIEDDVRVAAGEIVITPVEKYYPPDVAAGKIWLSARQKALWSDVQRTESYNTTVNITKIDFGKLSNEELMLAKKLGLQQMNGSSPKGHTTIDTDAIIE